MHDTANYSTHSLSHFRRALSWGMVAAPFPLVLVGWELVARSGLYNAQLFPPPLAVLRAFLEMFSKGELQADVISSVRRGVIGYFIGCFVGVSIGTLTGRSALADRMLGPLIHVLRSFPPVAIVPFAILWFGLAESAKYFLVFWGVFFPVWINTHAGMSAVDLEYLWAGRSLGAKRRHLISFVMLPAALPHILAGMRVAIGIAFICVFVAEMSGVYEGIGFRISTSYLVFRVDKMIAALLVLGALGSFSDLIFRFSTRLLFPWTRLSNHVQ